MRISCSPIDQTLSQKDRLYMLLKLRLLDEIVSLNLDIIMQASSHVSTRNNR